MWMFLYLKLCSVLSAVAVITIDDKLDSPFSTDCFKRISIGERLVIYDVSRTAERKRVKECEEDCNNYKCTYFSFGISAAGNGTCELSTRREIARRRDADYDIYQRTKHCMEGRPTGYEESCYRRLYLGRRLNDRFIRHSLPCDTLQACQHQCSVEQQFECHGFNIRLDESGLGRGVCELTSVQSSYLDPDRDFYRDQDFDFYEKDLRNTSPNCGYTNEVVSVIPKNLPPTGIPTGTNPPPPVYRPWSSRPEDQRPWNHPPSYGTVSHPNEIPSFGDYSGKDRLHHTKPFDWPHGRSMPMGRPTGRLPGYIIIDADQNRPQQGRNPVDLRPNYGPHNVLNNRYPIQHHALSPGPADNFHGWPSDHHRQVCFQREYPAMRMRSEMIRAMHTLTRVADCESMCSSARFQCMGFTFRYSRLPDTAPNCYLTDSHHFSSHSDLVPDRDCDVYSRIPTCQPVFTLPDTDCFSRLMSDSELAPEVQGLRVSASSVAECELECLRSDIFICRSFSYRVEQAGGNCQLSDWPARSLTPGQLRPTPGSAVYERGSFGRGCEYDVGPPLIGPHPPPVPSYPVSHPPFNQPGGWGREAWQHFTVRGWPCRRGTQCALNKEVGFWSCEVEGGDQAQWDYCCRPQHACGYSQGYSYPWCYVGEAGPDQWRPCSENFYPNYGENRPTPSPFESHRGPWSSDYGPPSQWPISYLYPEPPPNETVYFHPNHDYVEKPASYYDDSPQIQFRPSPPPPYPKAIVQKLDVKQMATPDVPKNTEDEKILEINPRNNYAKKIKESESPKYVFGTSGTLPRNESVSNFVQGSTFAEFMSSMPYINDTVIPDKVNKTKAILDQIEKIIEGSKKADCNKTAESMEGGSSDGIGYARGFFNESRAVFQKNGDSAMTRFWNWGQENYFSKDPKPS